MVTTTNHQINGETDHYDRYVNADNFLPDDKNESRGVPKLNYVPLEVIETQMKSSTDNNESNNSNNLSRIKTYPTPQSTPQTTHLNSKKPTRAKIEQLLSSSSASSTDYTNCDLIRTKALQNATIEFHNSVSS